MTPLNDQEKSPNTHADAQADGAPHDQPGLSAHVAGSSPTGPSELWRAGLLIAGVVIVVLLVAAWRSARHRPPSSTTQAAGAADFDVDKARLQTKDLQTRAMEAISHQKPIDDLVPQVQKLVERYPRFASAHILLGQLYLQKGDAQKAYDQLDTALSLDNQQPEVHKLAGTLAMGLGQYEKAIHHFSLAAGLEPSNAKYRLFLAQCYIQLHQDDKARVTLLGALQIDSSLHQAYHALSTLDARQGKLDQAITQATRAIDHLPQDATQDIGARVTYTRWLAKLLQRDNRPADSLRVLEKLPEAQRTSPPVIEDMAIAWEMIGKPARGAALYESALGQHPDQWPLALGAARWYLKAGDKTNARRMADALRRINPTAGALKELNEKIQAVPAGK